MIKDPQKKDLEFVFSVDELLDRIKNTRDKDFFLMEIKGLDRGGMSSMSMILANNIDKSFRELNP